MLHRSIASITLGILLLAMAQRSSATNVSGNIATTTWDLAGSPYVVMNNSTITAGQILTIDPGVEVKFNGSFVLNVNGTLNATGATFTDNGTANSWHLDVNDGGVINLDGCTLSNGLNVVVQGGTTGGNATLTNCALSGHYLRVNGGTATVTGGSINEPTIGVHMAGGTCTADGTTIAGAADGLYLEGGTLTIQNITVSGCTDPIQLQNINASLLDGGNNTFTANTFNVVRIIYNTITVNKAYPGLPIPYYLPSSAFSVNSGITWSIASKAIVKVADNQTVTINGKLNATAIVGEEIVFTSQRDDANGGDSNGNGGANSPSSGIWYGIRFGAGADQTSTMTRCRVLYGGQTTLYGGVDVNDIDPAITECTFLYNRYGISLRNGSAASITDCTFGSSTYTPIAMTMDCNPVFTTNTFSFIDNQYDAIGIFPTTLTADNTIIQRDVTSTSNVTYVLLGDIIIPSGKTLNVDAGVVIKAYSQYDIHVGGVLNLNGTTTDHIAISSVADDNVGNPGDTNKDGNLSLPTTTANRPGGIAVDIGGSLAMTYVDMRFCNGNVTTLFGNNISSSPFVSPWFLFDRGGTVTVQNTLFSDGTYGFVGAEASTAALTNVDFVNMSQAPVAIQATADPSFTNVNFTNVGLTALGILGGTVNGTGTMAPRDLAGYTNITQVLLGDLTVGATAQLTVAPTVVVKMGSTAKAIIVNGRFKVLGNPLADRAVFTEWRDDAYGNPGDTNQDGGATTPATGNWYGIRFNSTADDAFNMIDRAIIRYAGYAGCVASDTHTGALHFSSAGGVVDDVLFESNRYAVSMTGNSNPTIQNCTVEGCTDAVFGMAPGVQPIFTNMAIGTTNVNLGIQIIACSISSNATLAPVDVDGFGVMPYLTAGFQVASSAELTIAPGTVFKYRAATQTGGCPTCLQRWEIYGALVAVGTSTEPIIFTSLKDDGAIGDTNNDGNTTVPGNFDNAGLAFRAGSNALVNHLQYVEFNYANTITNSTGVVHFDNAGGTMEDCSIQFSNQPAIEISGTANPAIQDNFINVIDDVPVLMSGFASPTFSNNSINNVSLYAIQLKAENWTTSGTLPLRDLAGGTNYNTYFVQGDIVVTGGAQVVIPAGAVFKFWDNTYNSITGEGSRYEISVTGGARLDVLGTIADPVIFTNYKDDSVGLPPDMNQDGNATAPPVGDASPGKNASFLEYSSSADDASVVEHVTFRYRNKGVLTTSASPLIANCTFDYLEVGIASFGTEGPHASNNHYNNLTQTPFRSSVLSIPVDILASTISGTTKKMIWIENETLLQDKTLSPMAFGTIPNIPYFFRYGYTIGTNATLTIGAGVMCKFAYNVGMTVQRGLLAVGAAGPGNTIVFTHEMDDFYGGDSNSDGNTALTTSDYWAGITFANSAVDLSCQLDHCVLRYAQRSTVNDFGLVRCQSASPTITNSRFQHAYYGVRAETQSQPVVNLCDFQNLNSHGVYNVSQTYLINAENCFWGNPSGPTHSGNPGGTGISVTDQVDYMPFLTGPNSPLMGDVSLNGSVQAYDASLVLQHTVSLITLTPEQLAVADVSGTAGVTAFDASLILQYTVGLINTFPAELAFPLEGDPVFLMMMTDPAILELPSMEVAPGETFTVDVELSEVSSLLSLDLQLAFDHELFTLVEVQSLLPEGWSLANASPSPGSLLISAASAFALTQDGPVVRLTFTASEAVTQPTMSLLTPVSVNMDEMDVTASAVAGEITIAPEISTGLPGMGGTQSFSIQPNPATDGFTVLWPDAGAGVPVQLQLYDNTGRMVLARSMQPAANGTGAGLSVQRQDLGGVGVKGLFFIRLAQGNTVLWERVVLQ